MVLTHYVIGENDPKQEHELKSTPEHIVHHHISETGQAALLLISAHLLFTLVQCDHADQTFHIMMGTVNSPDMSYGKFPTILCVCVVHSVM